MTNNLMISIIIPNLHSPIIHQTIESLLCQETDYQFEIIVVGQDKFGHIEKFSDKRLITLKAEKPYPPAIYRNQGAKIAKGDYLFFIDADCIASTSWINKHMKMHQNTDGKSLIGGGVDFPKNNFLTLIDNVTTFHEYMPHIPGGIKEQLPSLNLSLKKTTWDKYGGFNEKYPFPAGEDAELTTRMRRSGILLHFLPEATVTHLPNRYKIIDLVRHAYRFGRFSIKADRNFRDSFFVPFILRSWILAVIFSPLLSGYLLLKILFKEKIPISYWHTLPGVFILKIIWCIGFAASLLSDK